MVETRDKGERKRRKVTMEYQIRTPVLPEVFGAYERLVASLKARGIVRVDGEKLNKQLTVSVMVLMLDALPVESVEKALAPAAKRLTDLYHSPAPSEASGDPAEILLAAASQADAKPDAGSGIRDARKVAEQTRAVEPTPRKKKPGRTRG